MQQENIPIKVGLLGLLYGSQGTQFMIPDYQRNYTWVANREVKQLLDDIKVVLSGERNGWEYWLTEDGVQLGRVEGLRKNNE